MIRFTGTIHYKTGEEEAYSVGGAVQAMWEQWAARHGYPLTPRPETIEAFPAKTWQLYLAYSARPRDEGFDVWRGTVVDVDSADEPELVPPTLPAVTVEA